MSLRSCLIISVAFLCLSALAATTAQSQTEIPLSGTPPSGEVSGTISVAGEADAYYFDVPSGASGTWNMWTAVGVNSLLNYSSSPSGPPQASSEYCEVQDCDLDHTANHSRIDKDLTAGARYYLTVRGSGGTATGSYTLKVRRVPPDLEVNWNRVDFGGVSEPTSNTSVYVYNAGPGSFDWTVSESVSWLTVDPMSGTTSTEQDTLTVTVDPTGLTEWDSYSDTFTVSRDGAPADSETVTVRFTFATVTEIPLSGTPPSGEASGAISTGGEEDWYYVEVPAGEGGTWNMWTVVGVNTRLRLYDDLGADQPLDGDLNCPVEGCDLDHTTEHSRIDYDLTADTRYYLLVQGFGPATGDYTVKARKEPYVPPNNAPELTGGTVTPECLHRRRAARHGPPDWHCGRWRIPVSDHRRRPRARRSRLLLLLHRRPRRVRPTALFRRELGPDDRRARLRRCATGPLGL
jgi:hypothetical protein